MPIIAYTVHVICSPVRSRSGASRVTTNRLIRDHRQDRRPRPTPMLPGGVLSEQSFFSVGKHAVA
jgi:hypothetical protein